MSAATWRVSSAHSMSFASICRCRRPRSRSCCASACDEIGAGRHPLPADYARRSNAAITVSRRRHPPQHRGHRSRLDLAANERIAAEGVGVVTVPDQSLAARRHQSISLLPNVLAKQAARERGAKRRGLSIATGISRRIVEQRVDRHQGRQKVVTRPADYGILRGITRTVLIDVIRAQGLTSRSGRLRSRKPMAPAKPFSPRPSQVVMPVVRIDDRPVGNGAPGPSQPPLRAEFHRHAE